MRIGSVTWGESRKRQGTSPYSSDEAHLEVTVLFDDDAESRDAALGTAKEFVKRGLVDEPQPKAAKAPAKAASPAPLRAKPQIEPGGTYISKEYTPAPRPAAPSTPPAPGAKPDAAPDRLTTPPQLVALGPGDTRCSECHKGVVFAGSQDQRRRLYGAEICISCVKRHKAKAEGAAV